MIRRQTFYWLKRVFYRAMNVRKRLLPDGVWRNIVNTILEDTLTSVALAEKGTIINIILIYTCEDTRDVVPHASFAVKCLKPNMGNGVMNLSTRAFTGSIVWSVEKDLTRSLNINVCKVHLQISTIPCYFRDICHI